MTVESGVVDANVLAYALNADALHHAASRALLEAALDPVSLYVTSQILCEFYSVITNFRRVAVASTTGEALRVISTLLALPGLHVPPIPAQAVAGWMELLRRHPVTGADNSEDFEVFSELTVVRP
jgi:predicted nucleic acid-binding protein